MKRRRVLVSFPKSGRTWLRLLLAGYLRRSSDLPADAVEDVGALAERLDLGRLELTHDLSGVQGRRSWKELKPDKSTYRSAHVLLLSRGVADTLVSSYFQATRRHSVFDGELAAFVRSERFGARKIVTFLEQWYAARDVPQAVVHLRYESLHDDPVSTLTEALHWLGVQVVDARHLQAAIEFGRFENMRRLELTGTTDGRWLRPADPDDPESFKTRRGKVGGYRDYLDADDISYVAARVTESSCPWVRL